MNEKKLGQVLAFPSTDGQSFATDGMTKRFYAACAATQGMLSNEALNRIAPDDIVKRAFLTADELLKQEQL